MLGTLLLAAYNRKSSRFFSWIYEKEHEPGVGLFTEASSDMVSVAVEKLENDFSAVLPWNVSILQSPATS